MVDHGLHGDPPTRAAAWLAFLLLALALLVVILLAKKLSPTLEAGVAAMGAPLAVVGSSSAPANRPAAAHPGSSHEHRF